MCFWKDAGSPNPENKIEAIVHRQYRTYYPDYYDDTYYPDYYEDTYYPNYYEDIITVLDCQEKCKNRRTCQYFTFNKFGGICILRTEAAIHDKQDRPGSGIIFASKNCHIPERGEC